MWTFISDVSIYEKWKVVRQGWYSWISSKIDSTMFTFLNQIGYANFSTINHYDGKMTKIASWHHNGSATLSYLPCNIPYKLQKEQNLCLNTYFTKYLSIGICVCELSPRGMHQLQTEQFNSVFQSLLQINILPFPITVIGEPLVSIFRWKWNYSFGDVVSHLTLFFWLHFPSPLVFYKGKNISITFLQTKCLPLLQLSLVRFRNILFLLSELQKSMQHSPIHIGIWDLA